MVFTIFIYYFELNKDGTLLGKKKKSATSYLEL